ncbi:MAG TPA: alpha/beta hydrolase [Allosphingosinicella sp.]|nr:alpha/beta hydrolase [Allosphingosinicella sp.]
MKRFRFAVAALLLATSGCAMVIDERSVVRPVAGGALDPAALTGNAARYTAEQHWIERPDGARLHAVLLRQPGARATILYFGGNGYTIGAFGPWTASAFGPLGADLMIVDHRGYGLSTGIAGIAGAEEDGLAAFDHLQRVRGGPILVHGHSMGSFIAGRVGAHREAAAVILESSATTTEEWIASRTGGIMRALLRFEVDPKLRGRGNAENIGRIEEPLLIVAGGKDKTTPPILSQRLYDRSPLAAGRKRIVLVPQAGHNNVMIAKTVHAAYGALLAQVTGSSPPSE